MNDKNSVDDEEEIEYEEFTVGESNIINEVEEIEYEELNEIIQFIETRPEVSE